jgi:hypothetical protein
MMMTMMMMTRCACAGSLHVGRLLLPCLALCGCITAVYIVAKAAGAWMHLRHEYLPPSSMYCSSAALAGIWSRTAAAVRTCKHVRGCAAHWETKLELVLLPPPFCSCRAVRTIGPCQPGRIGRSIGAQAGYGR